MKYELKDIEIAQALLKRPGFMMRRGFYETRNFFEKACDNLNLTSQQYDVLFILSFVDQMTQANIGKLLDLDKSTTALVIKKLESKGLVERRTPKNDTRQRMVRLTTLGKEVYDEALIAAKGSQVRIRNILGADDYQTFLGLLARLVKGLDEEQQSSEDTWA